MNDMTEEKIEKVISKKEMMKGEGDGEEAVEEVVGEDEVVEEVEGEEEDLIGILEKE
jgi:hypothetical protein